MLLKNNAGQGLYLFAYDTVAGGPKTGDSANITGHYSLDGTTPPTVFATAHPTEIVGEAGVYWQPLAIAETNGGAVAFAWASSTTGVAIDPVIGFTAGVNTVQIAGAAVTPYDGIAQGGTSTTVHLATAALTVDNIYNGWRWLANAGTGSGQRAIVTSYVGSTQIATLDRTLAFAPDTTTQYFLDPPETADLTPQGLDAIDTDEPDTTEDGPVSTWKLGKLLRWLVMGVTSGTRTLATGAGFLHVRKIDGSASTVQAIADDGAGNETLGPPT
jgi:hypothetical protein